MNYCEIVERGSEGIFDQLHRCEVSYKPGALTKNNGEEI